jgi:hypothetical protein
MSDVENVARRFCKIDGVDPDIDETRDVFEPQPTSSVPHTILAVYRPPVPTTKKAWEWRVPEATLFYERVKAVFEVLSEGPLSGFDNLSECIIGLNVLNAVKEHSSKEKQS